MDPTFDLVVKTNDTTQAPKGNEKSYYLCDEAFMGGQGWPPKLVRTWLDRAGKKDGLGVLMVFRE